MNRHRFDLGDLQAFSAVVRLGSFRSAAQVIHLSQPALSRRIDKLEAALGVRLIERTTRKLSLSAVGREFAAKTQAWLDDMDATLLGVAELAQQRSGLVTVACVPSAARHFLPSVLGRFHDRMPRIRVRIHDAHANEVLAAVSSGEADFGLSFEGHADTGVDFSALLRERFVLACRRDHRLAGRRSLRWSDIQDEPMLAVGRSSGNRLLLDRALSGTPWRIDPVFEARHVETVLGLVEAGLGVAVVPQLALHGGEGRLVGIALTAPVVQRVVGVITPHGRRLAPAASALLEFIVENRSRASVRRTMAGANMGLEVPRPACRPANPV